MSSFHPLRLRSLLLAAALTLGVALAGCHKDEAPGQHDQHQTAASQQQAAAPQEGQVQPSAATQPAAAPQAGGIVVENAWARPAKAMEGMGATSAAYFVIRNAGSADDNLLRVSTDVAGKAEMHETVRAADAGHDHNASDAMTMRPVEKVTVPAGGTVEFKPGGLHVMLMDLKRDLAVGDRFRLTLTFEKGGEQTVEVEVRES